MPEGGEEGDEMRERARSD
jgi:hypothetical protein